MKLTPEQRRIARAILEHADDGLVALTHVAGLDPATAWVGADMRGVVCAGNVTGFVFRDADLRGADFRRARGKTAAMFEGAVADGRTRGLPPSQPAAPRPDFDSARVREMVLAGEAIPTAWVPFVTELDVSFSNIADVAPLAGLTALQSLDLGGTRVSDVARLAGLTALQSLDLRLTRVTDVAPLVGLTALQRLDLTGTWVSDVAPLAGLTALQSLSLWGTPVRDVAPLARLTALQSLDLSGTPVRDVAPLAGLIALQRLNLIGTPVNDIAPLAGLTALQSLDLTATRVSDVAPLAGLRNLQIRGAPVRRARGKRTRAVRKDGKVETRRSDDLSS